MNEIARNIASESTAAPPDSAVHVGVRTRLEPTIGEPSLDAQSQVGADSDASPTGGRSVLGLATIIAVFATMLWLTPGLGL